MRAMSVSNKTHTTRWRTSSKEAKAHPKIRTPNNYINRGLPKSERLNRAMRNAERRKIPELVRKMTLKIRHGNGASIVV